MKIKISDVETAGLGKFVPPATGVVQVAWLDVREDLTIKSSGESLVNPGCKIQPGAQAVHGISDDQVKDAPKLAEVYSDDEPLVFVAHNVAFDYKFLAPYLGNVVGRFCTLRAARRYLRAPDSKLITLVKHYGLPEFPAHDAGGDVLMTYHLLLLLLKETGLTFKEIMLAQETPMVPHEMPFGMYKGTPLVMLETPYIAKVLKYEDLDPGLKIGLEMVSKSRGNRI